MEEKQTLSRRDGRIAAMQFLYAASINPPDHLEESLSLFFKSMEKSREYYSFGEELIQGCWQHLDEIDGHIRALAQNWEFDRIAKIDLSILRLAIYEMLYRRDIPPVVSINEAIDLSKQFSNLDSRRFINGVLDRFKKQLDRPAREALF